jgi:hypothetical protein
MGLIENSYHGWVLSDQRDGAVFVPKMNTIDSVHIWNHGKPLIPVFSRGKGKLTEE